MSNRAHATSYTLLLVASTSLLGCSAPLDVMEDVDDEPAPPQVLASEQVRAATTALPQGSVEPALVEQWIRWALAQPWSNGPINDPTGTSCGWGQEGTVWFLAGTSGGSATRECDVPRDKALFFPLLSGWAALEAEHIPADQPLQDSMPHLLASADAQYDHTCGLTLRVDGVEVAGTFEQMVDALYVDVLDPFDVELHPDNFMEQPQLADAPAHAVSSGHYARLDPLPPGDHVLELGGATCDGTQSFANTVTYLLHVQD